MLSRWQSTIVDERGNVQPLANLTVRNEADQSLAKMWASPGTSQPLPDGMVQADGNGYAYFYAPAGLYRIQSNELSIDWRHVDVGAAVATMIAQQALDNALPTYGTLAEMQADTSQPVDTMARVVDDPAEGTNGFYLWDGAAWNRTSLQPASAEGVDAAIAAADEAKQSAIEAENSAIDAADSANSVQIKEQEREQIFEASQEDRKNRFDDFIASSGYQFLGDYAAGIEITEYNQIVRDADGEFWRLSGQVELPYTTTGAGLPEGDALTPLGDAVLRQGLAQEDGAGLVGFKQLGAGAVDRNLMVKARENLSPEDYGAAGDGLADDTASFLKYMIAAALFNGTVSIPKATYLLDGFTIPAGVKVYANGSKFVRRVLTDAPLITVHGAIYDAEIDGRVGVLGAGSLRDRGFQIEDSGVAFHCQSHDNPAAGFVVGNIETEESAGQFLFDCESYNNGLNPGPSGTGDGFYATNASSATLMRCVAYGNARSGIVASSYSRVTGTDDNTLSRNVKLVECHANDNGYNDINMEAVTAPKAMNCTAKGSISFRNSPYAKITQFAGRSVYGSDADYVALQGLTLNKEDGNGLIFLTGKSPIVSDVLCDPAGAGTPTGSCVEILPSDGKGNVSNVRITRADRGFRLNVDQARGLTCESSVSGNFSIGPPGAIRTISRLSAVNNGRIEVDSSGPPTSGEWQAGDIVWNSVLDGANKPIGWVCRSSGSPGAWSLFGQQYVDGVVTYDAPSIEPGSSTTTTVPVDGCAVGDFVLASLSTPLQGLMMTAHVSAVDVVTVTLFNPTSAAIDRPSITLRVRVAKRVS